ncbi:MULTISPECIES: folate family ECF transporter S component [unclassified Sedimentibacter]|uniref:folate family ECF transporter S component n=1 Tax=unclassified Sedimentibacter TaxID=2649220 RepID=UPI0027E13DB4|nr:folate family ECF transporter S component [Sedimentibacter sp. MB35-C1]WMJ78165.1 folate family ECF transporter S component [Sedimentibacter sp. MB35-C1]
MRGNTDSQKFTSLTIVRAGLFIAMSLVLKIIFEIYIPLAGIPALRINFASVPLIISGMLLGPAAGFISGAAADIINFIAKPGGPFFPGFTLVSALSGFLPGLIYKYIKKDLNYNLLNTIFISLLSVGFVSVFLYKGLITFDGGIFYDGKPLSILYIAGFFTLVAIYIMIPIKMTSANNNLNMNKIVFTVSVTQLITSVILNTYFLSVVYGKGVMIFLPARILANFFMIPLYSVAITAVLNVVKGRFKI